MIKYKLEILNGADTNQYLILLVKLVTVATPPLTSLSYSRHYKIEKMP